MMVRVGVKMEAQNGRKKKKSTVEKMENERGGRTEKEKIKKENEGGGRNWGGN